MNNVTDPLDKKYFTLIYSIVQMLNNPILVAIHEDVIKGHKLP